MHRSLIGPAAYVQGPDVLGTAATYERLAGASAALLGGDTALSVARTSLEAGLSDAGLRVTAVEGGVDDCTFDEIERLADRLESAGIDTVLGVGGGVAIDVAKGVSDAIGAELGTVPTVASTDAPCSAVSVVYDDDGGFAGYVRRDRNPELVAVDTRIVAEAPVRFLRHGMGDAFATRFEAEAADRSGATTHAGGLATDAALTLARRSYRNLRDHGTDALAAVRRDAVTPAVERIVETNTLLSGVGFESGGLGAAHAFTKGLSRAGATGPHGLEVGLGTIAQLVLEGREGALDDALACARDLGLTTTLADLDVRDRVDEVAAEACRDDTTMRNEPVPVDPAAAADALRTADELVAGR